MEIGDVNPPCSAGDMALQGRNHVDQFLLLSLVDVDVTE